MVRPKARNRSASADGPVQAPGAWDFQDNAGLSAFLTGEKSSDFNAFLDMVKECGRYLNAFVPPEGFQPQAAAPPLVPTPEMTRALGTASLADFYDLALTGEPPESRPLGRVVSPPQFFPRGPETVRAALGAVEADLKRLTKSVADLERSWPANEPGFEAAIGPLERRVEKLSDIRANLVRAARLWARMKEAAALWPPEAKRLLGRARRLADSAKVMLRNVRVGADEDEGQAAGRERRGLTRVTADLRLEVEAARTAAEDGARWQKNLDRLSLDFDDFLAGIMDGEHTGRDSRDWNGEIRKLSSRLTELEREERRLADESAGLSESLTRSLSALDQAETRLAGLQGRETLDRLESLGRGAAALLNSAIERRRDLARVYTALPQRLGRPVYLEKIFLESALSLGRAQSLLEDLRHRLALAGGRLSTTHRLRSEGDKLAERLARPPRRGEPLKAARRRLGALARAVDQRLSLAETKGQLEEALAWGQRAEKELAEGRGRSSRLYRELQAATLEKERLAEKLAEARRGLTETGRLKARLIKVFAGKSQLLEEVDSQRRQLLEENEGLKAERLELKRKRSALATLYVTERAELKRLTAELRAGQSQLAEARTALAERRDLETRLDQTRRERETVEARRREVEAALQDHAARLAETSARAESLAAELVRHREELAEASGARSALGEQTAALRRRLDVMRQAHGSLLKTLDRRDRQLGEAQADRERMEGRLTRRKKTILRLVTARQRLRSELGAARLKMTDLDAERRALNLKLDEARAEAGEAHRVRAELEERLTGVESEKTALENRLVELEAEKSWLSERTDNLGAENDRLSDQVRELSDEGERTRERLAALDLERETLLRQTKELGSQKTTLTEQVTELSERIENDLTPFIKILGQALWRSEAQLKRARTAGGRLVESFKLEADVREANLRLKAAGREIELTENAQAERTRLETALADKLGQLAQAQETIRELEAAATDQPSEREALTRRSQQLAETVTRLNNRTHRLGRALTRLGERRKNETAEFKQTLEEQNQTLENQRGRLAELEPLVAHFLRQGQSASPELAAYMAGESRVLTTDLAEAGGTAPGAVPALPSEIQSLVGFLAKSFVKGVADLAQAREERSQLAEALAAAGSTREVLENSLSSREAELSEVRNQAFALSRERDQLKEALTEKTDEAAVLKAELAQADHDLAETDGRLEAAWAAANYLGTRAGDSLGAMRSKLETQARQVDSLTAELKNRDSRIRELTSRQNQLALLYWTLIARLAPEAGAPGARPLPALPAPADPTAEPADEAAKSGGHTLGRELLEGVKKVARRSLFTLLLTGSLVMGALPAEAAASPGPALAALPEAPTHLMSRLNSDYIGRSVGLEAVESGPRLAGRSAVETRLAEMVDQLAGDQGLTNGEFLSLVRTARPPESPVHLDDFSGPDGGLALLAAHFPKMTRQLSAWPADLLTPDERTRLMKQASDFKPGEGGFWERLFFDLLAESEPGPALRDLLAHLDRKQTVALRPRPEFAGRLAPCPQIENLGPARFTDFMSGHIKSTWPLLSSGRGRDRAARRLAGDIYFAARLFRLPVTFLAALAHQDAESGLIAFFRRGATASLHDRALDLSDLAHNSALVWLEGRPPLCDLDEALTGPWGRPFVEAVYRKKNALILALNKILNADNTLLSGLRPDDQDEDLESE